MVIICCLGWCLFSLDVWVGCLVVLFVVFCFVLFGKVVVFLVLNCCWLCRCRFGDLCCVCFVFCC